MLGMHLVYNYFLNLTLSVIQLNTLRCGSNISIFAFSHSAQTAAIVLVVFNIPSPSSLLPATSTDTTLEEHGLEMIIIRSLISPKPSPSISP